MYNHDQLHPKHKFVIAQMALDQIATNVIDFYRCTRLMLEYGSTCIEISEECGFSRQHVHNMMNNLIKFGYVYKEESRYYIMSRCIKDKHLIAGMNASGYI